VFLALCNQDPNGNVPLGKSCNRYWQCQGGYPRLQRCPAQLVFDRHTLRCIAPPTEDCEAPSTAAPFLDEDDDDLPPRRGQQNLEDEEENLPPPRPQQAKNNNNAPVPLQQRPNNNNNRPRN
jgi:Chitin binding Peritrophin-A domain